MSRERARLAFYGRHDPSKSILIDALYRIYFSLRTTAAPLQGRLPSGALAADMN